MIIERLIIRKLKERVRLKAIPHRINDRIMFAEDAVNAAIVEIELRANVPQSETLS